MALQQALAQIAQRCPAQGGSVMIIGRYNKSAADKAEIKRLSQPHPQLTISTMTAHKSKGKQADYVIVTGVTDGTYGFPSQLTTDPMLEALLPKLEDYQHAEERRLFYVALSRAKQSVFVLTELGKASVFIKELKRQKHDVSLHLSDLENAFVDDVVCPECMIGKLVPIEGKFGLFYGCTEPKHLCNHTVQACDICQKGPLIPTETAFVCAAPDCDHSLERCPSCGDGMLRERSNSRDNSRFLGCSNFRFNEQSSCRFTRNIKTARSIAKR